MRAYFGRPRIGNEVDQILARQRSFFERAPLGSWIAVGAAEEVVATSCWGTNDVPRRWRGGNGNGQQLRVSLWSDVVQVRAARRRQGTAKGYELVDPDLKALAWAMLAKGARCLRDLERLTPTGSRAILEGNLCG